MANKPLKSIKLPGLEDTYTFVQNDATLSVSGAAADAKATGDALAAMNEAAEAANAEIRKLQAQVFEENEISDFTDYIHAGRANIDGTISARNDTRYILKKVNGLFGIEYIAPFWMSGSAVFYDNNMNVLSYINESIPNTNPRTITNLPDGIAYYAINYAPSHESYLYVKETISMARTSKTKQEKFVEYTVENLAGLAKRGTANADGTFSPRSDAKYVKRNCKSISSIYVEAVNYISNTAIVFYDASDTVVSVVDRGSSGFKTFKVNVPSGAVTYAVNSNADSLDRWLIRENTNIEMKIAENGDDIDNIKNTLDVTHAKLVLPTWMPAVVGFPLYLYFENMIADGFLKDYNLTEFRDECQIYTPTDAGNNTLSFSLKDKNKVVDTKSLTIRSVSQSTSGSAKVLIIGDSKSAARTPWSVLHELLENDSNVSFTFIGTVTSGDIRREAYSGKSVRQVCNDEFITGTTPNIFYDANVTTASGTHFSFASAVSNLGETPDIVFIDHGANQWGASWSTIKGCYDDMIASIHAVDPSIIIVIVAQEGTGLLERVTYATDGKYWMQNNNGANEQRMLSEYDGRENENIYVMGSYLCFDLYRDFPICELPATEHSVGLRDICVDGTHPGINANAWNASTAYKYGSWVVRNGKGYGCKKAHTNVDPETDDGTYWAECKNPDDGYTKKGFLYYYMLKYLLTVL